MLRESLKETWRRTAKELASVRQFACAKRTNDDDDDDDDDNDDVVVVVSWGYLFSLIISVKAVSESFSVVVSDTSLGGHKVGTISEKVLGTPSEITLHDQVLSVILEVI